MVFGKQEPAHCMLTASCLVNSVDLEALATTAVVQDLRSHRSTIQSDINSQVVFEKLEIRLHVDMIGKRGTSDCFDPRQRSHRMIRGEGFGRMLM